jgi:hypothetical protein
VATTDPDFWGPVFHYLAFTGEHEVSYDGIRVVLYGIDWRRLPLDRWFDLLGERELTGESGPAPPGLLRPAPLSYSRFSAAVRSALRDLHAPEQLRTNRLMGSRLADDLDTTSPERLRRSIVAAIGLVGAGPRNASLGRVLDRTYVRAASTQEAAADVLGLPFSTYRRHLTLALEKLTDVLWDIEIGERRPADLGSGRAEVTGPK